MILPSGVSLHLRLSCVCPADDAAALPTAVSTCRAVSATRHLNDVAVVRVDAPPHDHFPTRGTLAASGSRRRSVRGLCRYSNAPHSVEQQNTSHCSCLATGADRYLRTYSSRPAHFGQQSNDGRMGGSVVVVVCVGVMCAVTMVLYERGDFAGFTLRWASSPVAGGSVMSFADRFSPGIGATMSVSCSRSTTSSRRHTGQRYVEFGRSWAC